MGLLFSGERSKSILALHPAICFQRKAMFLHGSKGRADAFPKTMARRDKEQTITESDKTSPYQELSLCCKKNRSALVLELDHSQMNMKSC